MSGGQPGPVRGAVAEGLPCAGRGAAHGAPGRQGNSFCPLKYAVSYPNILPIEPHASSQ